MTNAEIAKKLRHLLCDLFGHRQPRTGWWGDGRYGRVTGGYRDGIGRTHFQVMKECPRCEREYILARFHGEDVRTILETSHD